MKSNPFNEGILTSISSSNNLFIKMINIWRVSRLVDDFSEFPQLISLLLFTWSIVAICGSLLMFQIEIVQYSRILSFSISIAKNFNICTFPFNFSHIQRLMLQFYLTQSFIPVMHSMGVRMATLPRNLIFPRESRVSGTNKRRGSKKIVV